MAHPLHKIIGRYLEAVNFPSCDVLKDPACGGKHHLPLFVSQLRSRKTEYCNPDGLIIKNKQVRVIIEIEESVIKPSQICGKFLTTALSSYFIHRTYNNVPIEIVSALFIQILDTTGLKRATSRIEQWRNLEHSIQSFLSLRKCSIIEYKLFWGDSKNFQSTANQLSNCLNDFLTDICLKEQ